MSVTGNDAFTLLEAIGTIAFALSGGTVAVRAGMDWLGVVVLAVVTAVGGGTLRDVLLGQFPIRWVEHPWPVALACACAVIVILVGHRVPHSTGAHQMDRGRRGVRPAAGSDPMALAAPPVRGHPRVSWVALPGASQSRPRR